MLAAQAGVIGGGAAAERRKHVSNGNRSDPDGFSSVMRLPNHLAVEEGGTTVWIHLICTVVSTSHRTPLHQAA